MYAFNFLVDIVRELHPIFNTICIYSFHPLRVVSGCQKRMPMFEHHQAHIYNPFVLRGQLLTGFTAKTPTAGCGIVEGC